MKTRALGRTGIVCSEIGLGTWALGSPVYGEVGGREAHALVRHALDCGITVFDTAPLYGSAAEDGIAERVLGAALGADRDQVLIATKFGRTATRAFPPRFHAAEARASVEASLRRLGTDRLDLLFFHSPFLPEEIADDVWAELGRLQQEGKVCQLGHSVSEFAATQAMSAAWMRERRIGVIQVVLSLFNRETRSLIATAQAHGVGVVARECLANGFLSGAFGPDTAFAPGTVNARYSRGEIAARTAYAGRLAAEFARAGLPSLPEAAYRWVLDQAGISLALSGARDTGELAAPVAATALPACAAALLTTLESLHCGDFGAA